MKNTELSRTNNRTIVCIADITLYEQYVFMCCKKNEIWFSNKLFDCNEKQSMK